MHTFLFEHTQTRNHRVCVHNCAPQFTSAAPYSSRLLRENFFWPTQDTLLIFQIVTFLSQIAIAAHTCMWGVSNAWAKHTASSGEMRRRAFGLIMMMCSSTIVKPCLEACGKSRRGKVEEDVTWYIQQDDDDVLIQK